MSAILCSDRTNGARKSHGIPLFHAGLTTRSGHRTIRGSMNQDSKTAKEVSLNFLKPQSKAKRRCAAAERALKSNFLKAPLRGGESSNFLKAPRCAAERELKASNFLKAPLCGGESSKFQKAPLRGGETRHEGES